MERPMMPAPTMTTSVLCVVADSAAAAFVDVDRGVLFGCLDNGLGCSKPGRRGIKRVVR